MRSARVRGVIGTLVLAALAAAGWATGQLWPRQLSPNIPTAVPTATFQGDRLALRAPAAALVAEVGTYSDELLAFLNSQYLWSRVSKTDGAEVVLAQVPGRRQSTYRTYIVVPNDILTAIPFLSALKTEGYIAHYRLLYWNANELKYRQAASQVLEASYRLPVPLSFDALSERQLIGPLTRFVLFKSRTDRRVREQIEPVPPPLTSAQARRQAEDIVAVARFYNIPLDRFLGIAAQENNYLSTDGDLDHAIWKHRAAPGDVVLARRHGRVLVSDYSLGVWQITRESLRYAHRLYLEDTRNYSLLPGRLRPSADLHLDAMRPEVLTTYAGLLFRHLLDYFHGNVALAVGAYNGGCGAPNSDYAKAVSLASESARNIVEQSFALRGWEVVPVKIISISPSQNPVVRTTFSDSVRAAANELVGEIADRVRNYRLRESKSREVAMSEGVDSAKHNAFSSPASSSTNSRPLDANSARE